MSGKTIAPKILKDSEINDEDLSTYARLENQKNKCKHTKYAINPHGRWVCYCGQYEL